MKRITIVGGGITGLMTGLLLYPDYTITIIDAGPDPRSSTHRFGATYSGLDARHISFTETSPWTTKSHYDLITIDAKRGGWLCIPRENLNDREKRWISQFRLIAKNSRIHNLNTSTVIGFNKLGIKLWEKMQHKYSFLSPVIDTAVMPIICRSREDLMSEFAFEHSLDVSCKLYEETPLPKELSPFSPRLNTLGNLGYFTLHGSAYCVKTICSKMIHYLESCGVQFLWNQMISEVRLSTLTYPSQTDAFVWCSGISPESAIILEKFNISLCGVIGCWATVENPGVTLPCKMYGPEPVNYINVTPTKSLLLMSGGYGFVGTRRYEEAKQLGRPIMTAFIREIKRWLPHARIREKAYCIRPATPNGVPTLLTRKINKVPFIIAVGHAAGGFTESPYTALQIRKTLKNLTK